jgi:uncharacterized protein (DUF2345 family)
VGYSQEGGLYHFTRAQGRSNVAAEALCRLRSPKGIAAAAGTRGKRSGCEHSECHVIGVAADDEEAATVGDDDADIGRAN